MRMLRGVIKTASATALHWTGADRVVGALSGATRTPLIIGYHRVVDDYAAHARTSIPAMLTSRRTLERQLDWIGRRYRFVSLHELGRRLASGARFDAPVAAITFDDGYRDVYYHAVPLLRRKGIPAAFFVVTDLVGTSHLLPHDHLYLLIARAFSTRRWGPPDLARRLAGLPIPPPAVERLRGAARSPFAAMRALLDTVGQADVHRVIAALGAEVPIDPAVVEPLRPLTWEMLSELQSADMTIGSHTQTHAWLTHESGPTAMREAARSRQQLESRLGTRIDHLAYPDGRFDARVVEAVAAAGYRFAYTTCHHRDPGRPLLTVPRRLFWENSGFDVRGRFSEAIVSCQVNRMFDWIAGCARNHAGATIPVDPAEPVPEG